MDTHPTIIQGGMGVAISNWRLARAVAKTGQLGVVSGTALPAVFIQALQRGDPWGNLRRAVEAFPVPEIAQRVFEKYYVPRGEAEGESRKLHSMFTVRSNAGLIDLTVVSSFVEVFLAREGHENPVGINLLEKIQLPNLATLYGAMLAGVSYVIVGAGIPLEIPGVLDKLAAHEEVSLRLNVEGAQRGDDYRVGFNPSAYGYTDLPNLRRPDFLAIISSNVLAMAIKKRASGSVEGFIVETPTAGGHNAPPRGPLTLDDRGQPIYGEKDRVDLKKLAELGLPFWLAGSYGSPEKLQMALENGAQGIQIGTAFAFCDDSGMTPDIKVKVMEQVRQGTLTIDTDTKASPTGFPFKVAQLDGTLSDEALYVQRQRACYLGYLRHLYKKDDGKLGYRCPSEPVDLYVKKGGMEEDTVGRKCLCNALVASAGYPQRQPNGSFELPLVTSGDDVIHIERFLRPGKTSYTASDVIEHILSDVYA